MEKRDWDKISQDYYSEILSPIKNSIENPLFEDIKRIKDKNNKSVIDLGCGIGELENFLSRNLGG